MAPMPITGCHWVQSTWQPVLFHLTNSPAVGKLVGKKNDPSRSGQGNIFLWGYWACFATGSTAWHPFSLFLLQTPRDAAAWGTWLRTLHWWRKVGKDRRRRRPNLSPAPSKIEPMASWFTRRALYRCATTPAQWDILCFNKLVMGSKPARWGPFRAWRTSPVGRCLWRCCCCRSPPSRRSRSPSSRLERSIKNEKWSNDCPTNLLLHFWPT